MPEFVGSIKGRALAWGKKRIATLRAVSDPDVDVTGRGRGPAGFS
jgi:hypothetical protein